MIFALTNGVWEPGLGGIAGSAPADAAGKITISLGFLGSGTGMSAGRNIKLDLSSPALVLTNSGFDASLLNIAYITNSPPAPALDFRLTGTGVVTSTNGSSPMIGTSTNGSGMAYLTNTAGQLELILPVNVTNVSQTMSPDDTTIILKGQIIATAPANVWPFAASLSLSNNQITLSWPSVAGQNFAVLVSTNLRSWSNATGNPVAKGNVSTWTTSQSVTSRFYRVQLQ